MMMRDERTGKDLKDIREVSINSTSIPNNSVIPKIIGRFESLKSIKVNGDESSCNLYYPLNTFQTNGNLVGISEEIGKCINLEEVNFSFNNLFIKTSLLINIFLFFLPIIIHPYLNLKFLFLSFFISTT